jgi:hypothetical protein
MHKAMCNTATLLAAEWGYDIENLIRNDRLTPNFDEVSHVLTFLRFRRFCSLACSFDFLVFVHFFSLLVFLVFIWFCILQLDGGQLDDWHVLDEVFDDLLRSQLDFSECINTKDECERIRYAMSLMDPENDCCSKAKLKEVGFCTCFRTVSPFQLGVSAPGHEPVAILQTRRGDVEAAIIEMLGESGPILPNSAVDLNKHRPPELFQLKFVKRSVFV